MAKATLRLFFALWPDPETQAAIADLAQLVAAESKGRAVAADNVHLTLAFLGAQPATGLATLRALAAAVRIRPFELALDEIGGFRRAGIAWLGASIAPPEIVGLHADLASNLADAGIILDARQFSPHLTLARRVAVPVRRKLAQPIRWKISSFALVASELDRDRPRYRLLEAWNAESGTATSGD